MWVSTGLWRRARAATAAGGSAGARATAACASARAFTFASALSLALALPVAAQTPVPASPLPAASAPTSSSDGAPGNVPAAASAPGAAAPAPAAAAPAPASAAPRFGPDFVERLQVADPFIELRTGPGRGYPVFHVVERHGWIRVELRRTDWYRVRSETAQGGIVGWVHRSQMESTLTEAGAGKTFRDLLLDDYLGRRVEFGVAWGQLRAEPMLKLFTGVRLGETLGAELTFAQVQGAFSGSDLWHLSLVSEPWSDHRLSPFASVGFGRFRNVPNASLVQAQTVNANIGHAGIGLRWHLSERFVARLDWSLYAAFVSEQRTLEYRATTLGISFFF